MPFDQLSPRHQAEVLAQLERGKPIGVARAAALRKDALAVAPDKPMLRQKSGPALNKWESAFFDRLKIDNPGCDVLAHPVTLRLANGVRYTPDFIVFGPIGAMHAYEVKGHMRDDAAVKIKVAASTYPKIQFTLVTRVKGSWRHEEVRS